jgi:hypothetical protein
MSHDNRFFFKLKSVLLFSLKSLAGERDRIMESTEEKLYIPSPDFANSIMELVDFFKQWEEHPFKAQIEKLIQLAESSKQNPKDPAHLTQIDQIREEVFAIKEAN